MVLSTNSLIWYRLCSVLVCCGVLRQADQTFTPHSVPAIRVQSRMRGSLGLFGALPIDKV